MATDRPDDADADSGWIFEPQSDDEAGLSYRGESPRGTSAPSPAAPANPSSGAPATPSTATPTRPAGSGPADPGVPTSPVAGPSRHALTPADPDPDDTGLATAPFTPDWAAAPPTGTGIGPGMQAAGLGASGRSGRPIPPSPAVQPRPAVPPPGAPPGSPRSPSGRPPAGGGPGQAMAVGALIGTVVLLVAWFFLLRDPGADATRATPVRSTAVAVSPSPTPTPTRTRTTPAATRTTARPSPTRTSASPTITPTPSPTSTLNDAANRLGWTYLIDGLGPVKLGLSAAKATALGVLQEVPSACDAHSPTELLGATRVYSTGGEVTAIDIRTAAFPSGRGVRVGAPLESLKTMYGDALKSMAMTDGDTQVKQWALTSNSQFVAYIVGADGAVSRIVIGYRGPDGSITLPPPC